jgi:cell division transport system ATP-binding protein
MFGTDLARVRPAARARLRRRIGLIDQDRRLVDHLSVLENTALPLLIDGASAHAAHIDAADMLDWVGLGGLAAREARLLSRGQRLLAAVARAVVGRPALLLADEPTEGLGEADGSRLIQLLLEMNRLGATVLIATRLVAEPAA